METYQQMVSRLKDSPVEITPAMIQAAFDYYPYLPQETIKKILEAGLPYSMASVEKAQKLAPEVDVFTIDLMLDAAIAAI